MRLSKAEAYDLVGAALEQVEADRYYRLGQAIWNLMPLRVTEGKIGTEVDFFYQTDDQKAYGMFMKNFVES